MFFSGNNCQTVVQLKRPLTDVSFSLRPLRVVISFCMIAEVKG